MLFQQLNRVGHVSAIRRTGVCSTLNQQIRRRPPVAIPEAWVQESQVSMSEEQISLFAGLNLPLPGVPQTSSHTAAMSDETVLRNKFDQLDSEGNGTINQAGFTALVRKLGLKLTDAKAAAAFRALDVEQSHSIEFAAFSNWWLKYDRKGLSGRGFPRKK